jgi:hypothetical protein
LLSPSGELKQKALGLFQVRANSASAQSRIQNHHRQKKIRQILTRCQSFAFECDCYDRAVNLAFLVRAFSLTTCAS